MVEKVSVSNVDLETKELLYAAVADITDLRTKFAATLAKLDADAGVSDTNYASLGAVATQQLTS